MGLDKILSIQGVQNNPWSMWLEYLIVVTFISSKKSMRKFTILFLVMLSGVTGTAQSKTTFKADNDTTSEGQIKRLEYILTDLLERKDIDTYSGYLTDDYVRISANGEVATKQQVLESFRKTNPNAGASKMYPHDLKVSVYGNTAILHAVLDIETTNGNATAKRTSLITKVFIKRNGNWYMASLQGTAVNDNK
jgi:ketosteroid isomerase-like protein